MLSKLHLINSWLKWFIQDIRALPVGGWDHPVIGYDLHTGTIKCPNWHKYGLGVPAARARNLLYKTSKMWVGISKLRVENWDTRKKLRVDILNIVFFLQKFTLFQFYVNSHYQLTTF
jgi:hypothetical protein